MNSAHSYLAARFRVRRTKIFRPWDQLEQSQQQVNLHVEILVAYPFRRHVRKENKSHGNLGIHKGQHLADHAESE